MSTAPTVSAPSDSLLDLIGNTPMVEATRLDTGPCRLFLKLESQNPGGSIKDRIALSMIAAAEREGFLKPGGTIVEATAGNTGLALALVGQAKGPGFRIERMAGIACKEGAAGNADIVAQHHAGAGRHGGQRLQDARRVTSRSGYQPACSCRAGP